MKNQSLQNEKLDRIGRELLAAARARDEEIERIVAARRLFESVRARIEAEQARRETKGFFGAFGLPQIRIPQTVSVVLAVLTMLLVAAVGLTFLGKNDSSQSPERSAMTPENVSQTAGVENS